jgi:hypothetical protein
LITPHQYANCRTGSRGFLRLPGIFAIASALAQNPVAAVGWMLGDLGHHCVFRSVVLECGGIRASISARVTDVVPEMVGLIRVEAE